MPWGGRLARLVMRAEMVEKQERQGLHCAPGNWPGPVQSLQKNDLPIQGTMPVVLLNKVVTVNSKLSCLFISKVINTLNKMADIIKWRNQYPWFIPSVLVFGADFSLEMPTMTKSIMTVLADTDGAHIQTLLLTFFYPPYASTWLKAGHVYIIFHLFTRCQKGKGKKRKRRSGTFGQMLRAEEPHMRSLVRCYPQRYKGLGRNEYGPTIGSNYESETLYPHRIHNRRLRAETSCRMPWVTKVEPHRKWIEDNIIKLPLEEWGVLKRMKEGGLYQNKDPI